MLDDWLEMLNLMTLMTYLYCIVNAERFYHFFNISTILYIFSSHDFHESCIQTAT